jgi:hypothetical protein
MVNIKTSQISPLYQLHKDLDKTSHFETPSVANNLDSKKSRQKIP